MSRPYEVASSIPDPEALANNYRPGLLLRVVAGAVLIGALQTPVLAENQTELECTISAIEECPPPILGQQIVGMKGDKLIYASDSLGLMNARSAPPDPVDTYGPLCVPVPDVNHCPEWTQEIDSPKNTPGDGGSFAENMVAASKDGKITYIAVMKAKTGQEDKTSAMLMAYDTETGESLWPAESELTEVLKAKNVRIESMAVDSATNIVALAVTAYEVGTNEYGGSDIFYSAIAAFDGKTGQKRFVFTNPKLTQAHSITASRGKFVLAGTQTTAYDPKYQDVSQLRKQMLINVIDARSGKQKRSISWKGVSLSEGWRTATNPKNGRVYVAGITQQPSLFSKTIRLMTLDPATSKVLQQGEKPAENGFNIAGIAVSPDGQKVAVEQANTVKQMENGMPVFYNSALTLVYSAAGKYLWQARYRCGDRCGTRPFNDKPITFSSDSKQVIVAGFSVENLTDAGVTQQTSLSTVAYDAASGQQNWVHSLPAGLQDVLTGPSVVSSGNNVYLAGRMPDTGDAVIAALSADSGSEHWKSILKGRPSIVTNPSLIFAFGRLLFATTIATPHSLYDYHTKLGAYRP